MLAQNDDLTYEQALDIALAIEAATKDASELQKQHSKNLHRMQTKGSNKVQQQASKVRLSRPCFRCKGTNHTTYNCRFKEAVCHKCQKKGHIKRACMQNEKAKSTVAQSKVHKQNIFQMEESDDNLVGKLESNRIGQADRGDVIWLTPKVDGHFLLMELDTGSAISLVCKSTYEKYFAGKALRESPITLKTYSGEKIVPLGVMTGSVSLNNQKKELDLFVVSQQGPPLFGRDWLCSIKLNWNVIKSVTTSPKRTPLETVDDLKKKYSNVFKEELGTLKNIRGYSEVL